MVFWTYTVGRLGSAVPAARCPSHRGGLLIKRVEPMNPDDDDLTTEDIMRAVEASGTLDFWNDPEEDVYNESKADDEANY